MPCKFNKYMHKPAYKDLLIVSHKYICYCNEALVNIPLLSIQCYCLIPLSSKYGLNRHDYAGSSEEYICSIEKQKIIRKFLTSFCRKLKINGISKEHKHRDFFLYLASDLHFTLELRSDRLQLLWQSQLIYSSFIGFCPCSR